MLLFRVDRAHREIKHLKDPTVKLTAREVIIDGKRRNKETDNYFWTDDLEEAVKVLEKACRDYKIKLQREISYLQDAITNLDKEEIKQIKRAREVLRESNDDIFN